MPTTRKPASRVRRRGATPGRDHSSPPAEALHAVIARPRTSLLISTALATGVLARIVLGSTPVYAAGECGVASPASGIVTCTSTTGVGNPYSNGINYVPSGDLTLVLNPTVVVNNSQNTVPNVGPVQYGVAVPAQAIPGSQANLGNTAPDFNVTITLDSGASVTTGGSSAPGVYGATNSKIVTINNGGAVSANGTGSPAISAFAYSGSIVISNTGSASSASNTVSTIQGFVDTGTGTLQITNSGSVTSGATGGAYTVGISAGTNSTGAITITNAMNGTITTKGDQGSDGIQVFSTNTATNPTTVINNYGTITTQGLHSNAFNGTGNVGIDVSGGTTVTITNGSHGTISTAGNGSTGINVFDTSNITITNAGGITTQAAGAVGVYSSGGLTTIVNSGNITTHGAGGSHGIFAYSSSNSVSVTNTGTGTITISGSGDGIVADNVSGSGTLYANNAGTITVQGDNNRGITAVGTGATPITIVNLGTIKTYGASSYGIRFNQTSGGTGLVTINSTGTVKTYGSGASGIAGPTSAIAANVAITANNVIASGANASAIAFTTTGTATVTTTGTISGTVTGITIGAASTTLANSGAISGTTGIVLSQGNASVTTSGSIASTSGSSGTAIQFAGSGNTLTLQPGFSITGNVLATGTDTFQLGGPGSGTFNLSSIGTSQQYRGFSTFNVIGNSTWVLTGTGNQNWTIASGSTMQLGNGGTSGSITGNVVDNGVFAIDRSDVYKFGGTISGSGAFQQVGPGTTVLTASESYMGATSVNAGTLEVDGSIAASSSVTVNSGGTLSGTGTVDPLAAVTINNGGTLAPGNPGTPTGTLTITGSLVFQSAAAYLISINGASTSKTNVALTATLGGAGVDVAKGSLVVSGQRYTILTASGGVSGTFNPNVRFGIYTGTLSYDADDAYLTFAVTRVTPLLPPGAPTNVLNVAGAIDNFIAGGGTPPPAFQNSLQLHATAAGGRLDPTFRRGRDRSTGKRVPAHEFVPVAADRPDREHQQRQRSSAAVCARARCRVS